ncbi:putative S-adenosyl-L-methionine-dependent methyltransferase [Lupinus albus]|uniref:Putative S-adenosyl-L-methionine-dependent methyltransferase n=1 Tax=Lupinus albus TaxID=3870 RepID=A0A6A4Q4R1_LUPAL|nr:putative S-adenosyl-L-methionine-dependent methyltransferase [Lupinus albus]
MVMSKNSRGEGRKSSRYCSTVSSIAVFVVFCFAGIWIVMSSIVQMSNLLDSVIQLSDPVNEGKHIVSENGSKQFEVNLGDLLKESTRGDSQTHESQSASHPENQNDQKGIENVSVDTAEANQQEVVRDSFGEKHDLEKGSENTIEENYQIGKVKPSTEKKESGTMMDSVIEEDKINKVLHSKTKESTSESNMEIQEHSQVSEGVSITNQYETLNDGRKGHDNLSTQAVESQYEKESQKYSISINSGKYDWKLCKTTAGSEYIPCLDNVQAIRKLRSIRHYEHRERHCLDEASTCLVPLPEGYRIPIKWPKSRDMIWYNNAPHTQLVEFKGHQNWVKVTGKYLTFPGGGTQFKHGAIHYIEFIQKSLPNIAWGKRSHVILDVGCGVASFGGYLLEKNVLTMSFAPKDRHEAQVQFALERGIPATLGVMGTKRLPFPSSVFDLVHCARCRVPWHIEGGKLLLELNRVLRPGGYFVWSATPVYQKDPENVGIWNDMSEITKSMCWDLVVIGKDKLNGVAAAIYRKPTENECYNRRPKNEPQMCNEFDDPNKAWNISLQDCMHKVPVGPSERGSIWPERWPLRLETPPYWLDSQAGVYGRAAPVEFTADYKHWKNVFYHTYFNGIGINWSSVRNVMDMRAVYGGFAAALKNLRVWVMNVVPIDSPDTLALIYERGLFGIYHDWCESFNTYPRSYDILHADSLFSNLKGRCNMVAVIAEVDRILRPEGYFIVRDNVETIGKIEKIAKSLNWDIRFTYSKGGEGLLCVQKTFWRPSKVEPILSAII